MNDNFTNNLCSKCGSIVNDNNYCTNCGEANINKNISVESETQINNQNNVSAHRKKLGPSFYLAMSLLNLFIILPASPSGMFVAILLGSLFAGDFFGKVLSLCYLGYCCASVVAVIAFVINLVKKGEILKQCFFVIFISFFLTILLRFVSIMMI